ncbi:hypothetical protein ECMP0210179_5009 [Escherichia coli MP021017.9]|nr:hypothetical protein ECMP0210179_5009 [Escherichia coli MP021017.9]
MQGKITERHSSCYRANETRQFTWMLRLEPKNTAVRSPESNRELRENDKA